MSIVGTNAVPYMHISMSCACSIPTIIVEHISYRTIARCYSCLKGIIHACRGTWMDPSLGHLLDTIAINKKYECIIKIWRAFTQILISIPTPNFTWKKQKNKVRGVVPSKATLLKSIVISLYLGVMYPQICLQWC